MKERSSSLRHIAAALGVILAIVLGVKIVSAGYPPPTPFVPIKGANGPSGATGATGATGAGGSTTLQQAYNQQDGGTIALTSTNGGVVVKGTFDGGIQSLSVTTTGGVVEFAAGGTGVTTPQLDAVTTGAFVIAPKTATSVTIGHTSTDGGVPTTIEDGASAVVASNAAGTMVKYGTTVMGQSGGGTSFTNAVIVNGELKANANLTWPLGDTSFVYTNVWARHYDCGGGTPTFTAGTGAGTGPTITVVGGDACGLVTVTAGTTPAMSAPIVTVNMTASYTTNLFPTISAADTNALNFTPYLTATAAGFTINAGVAGLSTGTYAWYYTTGGN